MANLSRSVRVKLERGQEHADALRSLVNTWESGEPEPYRFIAEIEDDSDPLYTHYRYFIRVNRPLPGDALTKTFGDCLNNFRSVLDHLIWELSVAHRGPNPPEPTRIKFPSAMTGQGSGGLHAVSSTVQAEVQGLHRDCAMKEPGKPSPFWMLCELSNVDKHRTVHVIVLYPASKSDIIVTPTIIGTLIDTLKVDELKDNTTLARIAVPRPLLAGHEVEVRARTLRGVAIPATTDTPLVQFGMAVDSIREAVEEAAERLRHHLP